LSHLRLRIQQLLEYARTGHSLHSCKRERATSATRLKNSLPENEKYGVE
jgi:hypothetical protein